MVSDNAGTQQTLDGDEVESNETVLNDFGEEMRWHETKAGFNVFEVTSLLQKSVRRSDEERCALCAFELCRSGHSARFWSRMFLISIEDLQTGSVGSEIEYYHRLATERYESESWEATVCAIHAALAAARARSTREATHFVDFYESVAKERAKAREEGREPRYDFPVTNDELRIGGRFDVVLDQHTYAGQNAGRSKEEGWRHFWTHAARVGPEGEPELSQKWQRRRLELGKDKYGISDEEIEHALRPVSEDEPWEEDLVAPDRELDSFE